MIVSTIQGSGRVGNAYGRRGASPFETAWWGWPVRLQRGIACGFTVVVCLRDESCTYPRIPAALLSCA
ncbi:hypothetical protein SAMN04487926_12751 [Paraburkholderia steynii]|uniref:Uncharacterized protein n=1 Tax=Paraburkholderia steynii TaxID=1245441 RepID=A0A7Z7FKP2_9BURK|nr:hypothetical protein SAMN04487926_12751 [Paraburkholderia steynii]